MNLHYITFSRQAVFLKSELTDAVIQDSFTQVKNELIISFKKPDLKMAFLQLSCNPNLPFVFYIENIKRQKNSTSVMREINNLKIVDIHIVPGDRIIIIKFKESLTQLYIQLFTNRSNFFIIDENQEIINSFKQQRKFIGNQIEIPSKQNTDLNKINSSDFLEIVKNNSEQKLWEVLKTKFQSVNQTILSEIFFRFNINKEDQVKSLPDKQLAGMHSEFVKLFKEMQKSHPRIYFNNKIPEKFSLIDLTHLKNLNCEIFDNINDALRVYNFQILKYKNILIKKSQYSQTISKRIVSLEKSKKIIDQKINAPSKKETYQKIGELILTQIEKVKVTKSKVTIIDYFTPNSTAIEISINPELTPQENAALYFQKAKNVTQKRQKQKQSLEDLKKKIEILKSYEAALKSVSSFSQLQKVENSLKKENLIQKDKEEALTFRVPYKKLLYKNQEIWVGKSARDNDTMTFKFAHKEDWWLHVQGYSGSHVIIRNPGKKEQLDNQVLKHAASLAITNSGAKHANYLPVIYTKVKYVRKPRKSPPGTVLPSHSKVIYADPLSEKSA